MTLDSGATKFYITTPIYYVNARPHIGHAYTTIVCDAIARRKRMLGFDTFFLTGTDEHGQKIERSAADKGKTPKQFADEVSAEFRGLWDRMGITYNRFIRTTDKDHEAGVQELFRRIRDNGYIYKGTYTGQYCVSDEMYVEGGPGTPCPECGRITETISEENYYFKFSAFQEKLLQLFADQPDFVYPETRKNEVLAFIRGGLRDLSISRSTIKWGIPVPDDPTHVVYVWFDALANYITALGYGANNPVQFNRYWPADMQVIGKEIVRFHAVYWPAFLMAAGLPLPRSVVVHGWLLFEESKMSKSRGNIVRTETILDVLGADALRYFLLREVPFGGDGSFSFDALVQRFNADLAHGYGNNASRTLSMITRYFQGQVPYPAAKSSLTESDEAIAQLAGRVIEEFGNYFDNCQFSRALESAWSLVAAVDKYIVEHEPWELAGKEDAGSRARLGTVLYVSAEALRIVTALVHPVLPESSARVWQQLGLGDITTFQLKGLQWGQLQLGTKLGKVEPVYPKADKTTIERMQALEQERQDSASGAAAAPAIQQPAAATPEKPAETAAASNHISIDDFAKVELRVGQVKTAEKVKGADRLLRLEVDIGTEVRQIVAGIAESYAPEQLIDRKVVIVANLAPRKLKGIESQGMIVAASLGEQGKPVLPGFLEEVPIGARLK